MRTDEEVRGVIAGKIKREVKRLKSFGTKAKAFDIAYAITSDILAFCSKSRWEEVIALKTWVNENLPTAKPSVKKLLAHLKERERELCITKDGMAKSAQLKEDARPWKHVSSGTSETTKDKKSTSSKQKHKSGKGH